jgi:predicted MPP superfamily phosphohydrolase
MLMIAFFLLIFIIADLYVFFLGRRLFNSTRGKRWYTAVFIFIALSFFIGRSLERISHNNPVIYILMIVGAYWFACMLYLGIGSFLIDCTSLMLYIAEKVRGKAYNIRKFRRRGSVAVCAVASILIIAGSINANSRILREMHLPVKGLSKPVSIVLVTDVHLGLIADGNGAANLTDRINGLKPDMIIIGGDLFDEDLTPVIDENMGDSLAKLKAPLGVFAVPGNHEYFGGIDKAIAYCEKHGIRVLRDSMTVAGPLCLAGRDDYHGVLMSGKRRKPLNDIMRDRPRVLPLVVIDHEPVSLDESVAAGAAFHLSGHTHAGQLWPIGYITSILFDLDRGYKKIGGTHVYVSTGYGTWGPPVRIGNRPELVLMILEPTVPSK